MGPGSGLVLRIVGIIGPFNFDTISGKANRIEQKYWRTELLEASKEQDIYALDIKKVTPIRG
jgi:hypothetical protein